MDVLSFAMQMEKDGEAYYRQLAHRTTHTGLRTILTMLADEEVKHQQTINAMQANVRPLGSCAVLTRAKNIFAEMKTDILEFWDESAQVALYQTAQELEEKSRAFYAEKASELGDDKQAEIFTCLAQEEAEHAYLLAHIVDFVSRPQQWLEDAEFNHLDEF